MAASKSGGEPAAPAAQPAADAAKAGLPKTSRKVIKNAELSIEVASPAAAESKLSSLVERLGGYVASSEREVVADEGARAEARVNLSLRVPAERLDEALREIKRHSDQSLQQPPRVLAQRCATLLRIRSRLRPES